MTKIMGMPERTVDGRLDLHPPPLRLLIGEVWFLVEIARLLLSRRRLRGLARGDGAPVLLLPGFGAGHGWMSWLLRFLTRQGYDARHWGLGKNRGNVMELVPQVLERVAELSASSGRTVRLVGWSLGGVIAREVARERPDLVAGVLTLGSPIVGGPRYTWVARRFERLGFDLDGIEEVVEERNRIPIQVPVTSIFTRRDGFVAWAACVDTFNEHVQHLEVRTSHLGLPVCPEVYELAAEWLGGLEEQSDLGAVDHA